MNFLTKAAVWGFLVGASGTALHADPTGGWLSPNGVSAGASRPTDPNAGQVGATMTLSPVEVSARVHVLHEQTRADARHIQHQQQVARSEKDIIKLNCVNDKLVQVKAQLNIGDLGESQLVSAPDGERMVIFENIAQAADNVHRLREEADQCIGEPMMGGGESSNSFTGPKIPDDPTKGLTDHPIEPPGYASPFN